MKAKASINLDDQFKNGEKFAEGVFLDKEEFLLLHAEENSEWPNFPYWKYASFGLISVYKNIYHSHVSYFWTFRYHHADTVK